MKTWGIRARILFLALVPATVIALALVLFFTLTRVADLHQAVEERGRTIVRQLAPAAEFGVFAGNRDVLITLTNSVLEEPHVRSATVLDSHGRPMVHSGPATLDFAAEMLDSPEGIGMTRSRDGASLVFRSPIVQHQLVVSDFGDGALPRTAPRDPRPMGYAQVELSLSDTRRRQQAVFLLSIGISLVVLTVSAGLGALVARDVVRPIRELTGTVERLEQGLLNSRVEERDQSELGRLARGVNALARTLEANRDDMQSRVDEATRELQETLDALETQNLELSLARRKAQEASQAKTEFLASMSHEIRTPLNGVVGYSNLLLKGPLEPQQREQAATVRRSAEALLHIVDEILDFSKIEAGRLELETAETELRAVIEEAMDMVAPVATEKGLELAYHVHLDVPPVVLTDPYRLRQVLGNLLSNAVKFTDRGSVTVRVMVKEGRGGQRLRFLVRDTGIGIASDQQRRLFQAFGQAVPARNRRFGGTGLGLVICRRLVEHMGGKLKLDSIPDQGTTVTFTIPCDVATLAPITPRSAAVGGTVLVHEGHAGVRLSLHEALAAEGYEVVDGATLERTRAALDAHPALTAVVLALPAGRPDLNLVRPLVDEMDPRLRARVIVLAGPVSDTLLNQADGLGFAAILAKPAHHRQLVAALGRLGASGASDPPEAPIHREADRPRFHGARVLVVEDNDVNSNLLVVLLSAYGVEAVVAHTGREALELVGRSRFHLVLMDIHLPELNGMEVTARLRALERGQHHTPVIAITADTVADHRQEYLAAGIDDYLLKPVDEPRLVGMLDRWLPPPPGPAALPRGSDAPPPPVLDDGAALRTSGNRPDLVTELRTLLRGELGNDLEAIDHALEAGRSETVAERAHRLAGGAIHCGARALHQAAKALQAAAEEGAGHAEVHRLQERLREEAERFLAAVAEREGG